MHDNAVSSSAPVAFPPACSGVSIGRHTGKWHFALVSVWRVSPPTSSLLVRGRHALPLFLSAATRPQQDPVIAPCHLEITQVTDSFSGSVVPAMVEVDAHITQRGCQPHSLWIAIKRADLGLISWKELGTGVKIFYSNSLPVERENPSPDPHA